MQRQAEKAKADTVAAKHDATPEDAGEEKGDATPADAKASAKRQGSSRYAHRSPPELLR